MSNRHCSNPLLQSLCPVPALLHWPRLPPHLLCLLFVPLVGQVAGLLVMPPSSPLHREGQGKLKVIVWLPIASLEPITVLMPTNGKGAVLPWAASGPHDHSLPLPETLQPGIVCQGPVINKHVYRVMNIIDLPEVTSISWSSWGTARSRS